jgi:hypothetical protein
VYLPPNLVGLKMSWLTVAIAVACQVLHAFAPSVANVLRETMDGPHRAGFAPRRSVCTRALAGGLRIEGPNVRCVGWAVPAPFVGRSSTAW